MARRRVPDTDDQLALGMTRAPVVRLLRNAELVVDLFAGGGGASEGIRRSLGRDPDIAINHDPAAIAMHQANHPRTQHYCESVFKVGPRAVTQGRPVGLAWFSPDCTFHSKASGGKPFRDRNKARRRRGLAGVVTKWAAEVRPRLIFCENVEEFQLWGPLGDDGLPDPERRGSSFRRWVSRLRNLGYVVEWRVMRACDYGAPTYRKRFFVIARCDGRPIVWPEPTHGPGRLPYRTAAECIDFSRPCPSIFGRKRPLAPNTMARIGRGVWRYVIGAAVPFVVPTTHQGDTRVHSVQEPLRTITSAHRGEYALVSPTLIHSGNGERPGQSPRVYDIQKPLGTVMAEGVKHALVSAFLAKHYGDPNRTKGGGVVLGSEVDRPLGTITTRDHQSLVLAHMLKLRGTCRDGTSLEQPAPTLTAGGTHLGEVRSFLVRYNRTAEGGVGQSVRKPIGTLTTKPRFGLVTVAGEEYEIVDIGMRMLAARELFSCQGFPPDYIIDLRVGNKWLTLEEQVRMCGNSVSPDHGAALVSANASDLRAEAA